MSFKRGIDPLIAMDIGIKARLKNEIEKIFEAYKFALNSKTNRAEICHKIERLHPDLYCEDITSDDLIPEMKLDLRFKKNPYKYKT